MIDSTVHRAKFTELETNITREVVMPEGNYSQTNFAQALSSQLESASNANGSNFLYDVSFIKLSNKLMIYNNAPVNMNSGFTLEFSTQPEHQSMARYFGMFNENGFHQSEIIGSVNILTSPFPSNFQRYENLQMRSTLCDNNGDNVLATIQVGNTGYLDMIEYTSFDAEYTKCTMIGNNNMYHSFLITDEWGQKINMNGQPIMMTLTAFLEK
jgi:hypothetical protein